jgi:predicted O-linked N-acetylglucosamine transferase (SPINDLY family)
MSYPAALHFTHALALHKANRFAEALTSCEHALALEPDHAKALGMAADLALKTCDWTRLSRFTGDLRQLPNLFLCLHYFADPELALHRAQNCIAAQNSIAALVPPAFRPLAAARRPIQVAYLSADFREHAVASLIAGLIEQHDRSRFEITGISFGPDDGSAMRKRLAAAFDRFYDVRQTSDWETARLIAGRQTGIAVDLQGYTEHARPDILAYRPAPVQISYLGYPGTTGASYIDYVIADPVVLPFDQQPWYTEKIIHLPDCYQANSARVAAPQTPQRCEVGLPGEGFVFCCFNNAWKIGPPVFDVWMRLLRLLDGSVLWLLENNSLAAANLRREASARGIDPARLVFAPLLGQPWHLARHRLAGLFLDTLPYNAHTTASDALWMGLPLVTCQGRAFAGRVAASLLHAIGLPELVATSLADYEALALRLASDPALLAAIRRKLAENRTSCALFDIDRFRCHIEAAYQQMVDIFQRGEPPRSFAV